MVIKVLIDDLFESECQTLVNTVNPVGIMGKGIALEFKKRFPDMYEDYVKRCAEGKVKLGEPYLYKRLTPPWILNFPTKEHWRSVSKLSDIVRGLKYLEQHYQEWGLTSLAMPPLGCGHGQLESAQPIIELLTDLFLRINTTHQAEIASTVHFTAEYIQKEQKDKPSETDVLKAVMDWKQKRRPPFDKVEVARTIRNLASLGLLKVKPSNDLPVYEEILV